MARTNRNSGKGGSLLDNGVAALAALSAGFVTYAMPEGLFARLIVASHIPDVLAAAQPPLGMKARLAVIAGVAILAYAAVWTLMRALDSLGGTPRGASAVPDVEEEAPRLRRADAHPDAPSRRPIRAGRDLGEPAFDDEPFELEPEAAVAPEPEQAFEPEFQAGPEPEPEPEPEPAHAAEPLPPFLVPQEPESKVAETPAPAPAAFVEPSFDETHEDEEEPEEETGAYEGESDEQSLVRLMQRFESGLGRKQQALDAAPPPPPPAAEPEAEAKATPVPQERVGHRLRSAISDLNRMSAPGR
ncbi:MAG TPA: hypothetical protein VH331_15510 [Allosphingosinicella sp.]|jgi:hypothetical protein|nr:hypothetical protein [Allosphingosinicella sp.]